MEAEPGFPCPNCGHETQVFYSTKTGDRIAWSCSNCKARGYFVHPRRAMLLET